MPTATPDIAAKVAALKAEVARETAGRPRIEAASTPRPVPRPRTPWRRVVAMACTAVALLVLPFVVLVRGAVYLYVARHWPTGLALAAAAMLTLAVVTAYGVWLSRRLTGRARLSLVAKWIAVPLVVGYSGHALLFLARENAKSDVVQTAYRATHPLLRLALSTLVLGDRDLVVTDMSRVPADYPAMGLPVYDRTLHYPQADGWVHAVDLRTIGRSGVRNALVRLYFWVMGFQTLRHVGTADHLHVELPVLTR
jgi:hypothetical protein